MKNIIENVKEYFLNYVEDILIFMGLFIVVFTTFLLNFYIGMYLLGVILTVTGVYLSKFFATRR